MYLHLGNSIVVPDNRILGIFDMDNCSWSHRTRRFLEKAEKEGRVVYVGSDLPRSFIVCGWEYDLPTVYISQLSAATLIKRVENGIQE